MGCDWLKSAVYGLSKSSSNPKPTDINVEVKLWSTNNECLMRNIYHLNYRVAASQLKSPTERCLMSEQTK